MDVKLFTYFNGAYHLVELSQDVNEKVLDTGAVKTDEGWTRDVLRYSLDGNAVLQEWMSEGRDCDGFVRSVSEMVCPVDRLSACEVLDGLIRLPDWQLKEERCYDEEAIKAGY